jgi:hypothetical protein
MPLEIDHIVPQALGGTTVEANLWLACSLCDDHKSDRIAAADPTTGRTVRQFDPRRMKWSEHFAWLTDGIMIAALTPTGRVTVVALNLNRPVRVAARRLWVEVGWHPPRE